MSREEIPLAEEMTQEGCRIALRLVKRRPLTWTLQAICRTRPRFRYPVYACGLLHFHYCKRKDRTRNLVVDGVKCIPFEEVCIGSRTRCERYLIERLLSIMYMLVGEVEEECHRKCFGLSSDMEGMEEGYYASLEEHHYCCYHRCDQNWRCAKTNCLFQKTGVIVDYEAP